MMSSTKLYPVSGHGRLYLFKRVLFIALISDLNQVPTIGAYGSKFSDIITFAE